MAESKPSIRVRFPPSPTGHWHLGGARTALFNWLFAQKQGGKLIYRIEDTDKERSRREFEDEITEALHWLGLTYDEGPDCPGEYGPYRQSERGPLYEKYLTQLLSEKKAYFCYCSKEDLEAERQVKLADGVAPKYSGRCRAFIGNPPQGKNPETIRFIVPEKEVAFHDLVRGKVTFDVSLFGDLVIAKDLRTPLYNFAATVDDFEMQISHVIRGEDHISNTPKQILIQEALGFPMPIYAHLPLLLASDRSKLSKRHMETSLLAYRDEGYLPHAILNFLALLGWHPSGDQEIFTLKELVEAFDFKRVQKEGAVFNPEKLQWMNQQHIKKIDENTLVDLLMPLVQKAHPSATRDIVQRIAHIERDRMKTLGDFLVLTQFFFEISDYSGELLSWKDQPKEKTLAVLEEVKDLLLDTPDALFTVAHFQKELTPLFTKFSRGDVLWPFRVALSGLKASPDPLEILEALGKAESLRRVQEAIKKLS